ncbi:DUF2249 domain-containing protein [Bosea sp. 124]|uniref:DUF2249 domain-containing protein n=1 Tax=Bosea sp. 124 TaxID=2135642 RepID=UPI000D342F5E|nr:DUF2249 domain-containing protein [Bosea sp. 124]PTM42105.1 uncharacterized protein (DUF2249 family) [Bosea sp. 124]
MLDTATSETTIDTRQIPPLQRHPLIFSTFEQLQPGEGFLLVNNHEPWPLLYQFNIRHPDAFEWEYQAEGPEIWRVRISRAA